MPQSTNLNKNPYYDDFSDSKNFYKVLFKPGVTVQTRELTTLQSILQNQIEKLGSAFFKKNSVVIPGGFAYDSAFYAVEVENNYKGTNIEDYFESLVGTMLIGRTSNVTAKVEKVLSKANSIRSNTTFYVKYQSSSSDFNSKVFLDGEELILNDNIQFSNGSILNGSPVAKIISPVDRTATSVGSAAKIEDGVYFVRGYLANVSKDVIILDQYTNTPSYRVGLNISEEIISTNEDSSLYDNAQGFSNYAAPGADRFKIKLSLSTKSLTDFNDENFIELFRVENGLLKQISNPTESSFITDILARRTFDESGNYYVNPFNAEALESLNNNLGNGGLYLKDQNTGSSIVPSEDTGVIKISPGKAYVKGFEVPTNIDLISFPKPRTTKHVESSSSSFYAGNLLKVNNVTNIPDLGLTTDTTIPLYDQRLVNGGTAGNQIGVARVYDFESYLTSYRDSSSQFDLRLFDIQTYSNLITDSDTSSIIIGDYIEGNNTNSSGFVKSISGPTIKLYQVSGTFIQNESLTVNGIGSSISIGTVTNYNIDDVKSISASQFKADIVLSQETPLIGPFTFNSGSGTITSNNGASFAANLKVADVIKYIQVGFSSDVYARITSISVNKDSINISPVDAVVGVCTGSLGPSDTLQTISLIKPQITQTENSSLFTKLNNSNIANVDFLNSNIYTKVEYTGVSKVSTTLTLPSLSGTDYVYTNYSPQRYIVINANGSVENLDSATLIISDGGKNAQFTGLSAESGPCKVITTQIKSNVTAKFKKLVRCNSITITNTKYNPPTNAGLTYTSIYGTRVEDEQISLNTSDIVRVHGVFESSTTSNPVLPWISISGLNSTNSNTDDLIVGELVVGSTSGAVAIYAEQKTTSQIYLIYKNNNRFASNETVSFSETGYTATISSVNAGDSNILDNYNLDNGQREHFYDFGRLIKKNITKQPTGVLKIFFDNFTYESSDNGDLISVNSYPSTLNKNQIAIFDGVRNTNIIDIRPKVSNYTTAILSPFDFSSRSFITPGFNAGQILKSNENFIFDYDFYLPRTDKITLSSDGKFNLVLGDPSENPIEPKISTEVLDVATIISSPYVYNISTDVKIVLSDYKRYTMSDIKDIDNRVSNLEFYTTLSLLEISTQNLLIEDANGFNRFKSGFFVDEFNNYNTSDLNDITYSSFIENKILSATKNQEKIDLSLYSTDNSTDISNINIEDTNCNNVKITGKKLSLDYSEVEQFKQPFASKVTNVNPFNIISWQGILELNPTKDSWSKTVTSGGGNLRRTTVSTSNLVRTRNVGFTAVRLKPSTRFKLLFDGRDLTSSTTNSLVFPKLLEITGATGVFQVGETVNALNPNGTISCKFKLCTPNHKSGPIGSPTLVYNKNPYTPSIGISTQYGTQSTILNIDISSLSRQEISGFWGGINSGYKLVGTTSKATASVSDIRLITNEDGSLLGSIWLKEEDNFNAENNSVNLNVYQSTPKVPGELADSSASAVYTSVGTITNINYYDPLAQTFEVSEKNGIVPTSVDVYFYSKDSTIPITLEIREVFNGIPGGPDKVIAGLQKTLLPSQIVTSSNASAATKFTFDTLTRLPGGNEYCLVLISDSNEYQVWVSELGAEDISTVNLATVNKIFITRQPSLGSLFKSQNGTTWVPSSLEDLKFTLNKASFNTTGGTVRFYNSTDITLNNNNLLENNPIVTISTAGPGPNDGYHMMVNSPNHGMYSANNKVEISGVISDILPNKLTVSYANTSTGPISVASTAIFSTFEGTEVSPVNPGYIQISDEIIEYTSVGNGQLLDITRGVYGTSPISHNINDLVYKYEFNNVSLNKINTEFDVLTDPKPTLDSYYVQIEPGIPFAITKSGGGSNVYASKNKQFSSIELNEDLATIFDSTQIVSSVRTVSSTSVDGSEISYVDQGYQTIGINSTNVFNTPRMVPSRINEVENLNPTQFANSRSFILDLNLSTTDSNVSPIIDLTQNYAIAEIYNINQPVGLGSYASDNRVNSNTQDPNTFIYVSNKVDLQQNANSLKVFLTAYRNVSSDIRVLYKIFVPNVPNNDQTWQLFPGYNNLDVNRNVINFKNNDGRSDDNVRSSLDNEYLDYSFTIDNLTSFTGFAIKIIGTSTNQAYSPLIKQLRVIAVK
jgi:hypothetical protein